VLEAAQQAAPHLPHEALGDLLGGQVPEANGHLAEAHLFVLDQRVGHLLQHLDVLLARQRALARQHASERVAQRAALGIDQLPLHEVEQRVHALAGHLELAGRRTTLQDQEVTNEVRALIHSAELARSQR
jgi:hypothetical protein